MANEIIFKKRNPILEKKQPIYDLIWLSYKGGYDYINGDNLFKPLLESIATWNIRKKRSTYINHTKQAAKILSGLIYSQKPVRQVSKEFNGFIERAARGKSFDTFMQGVATYSCLFTVGILVDQKGYDPSVILTEADRRNQGIEPYCCLYLPKDIRDFEVDEEGCIDWIILDNTHHDNSDPFQQSKKKVVYRLWTRNYYQDFEKIDKDIIASDKFFHGLGVVPFVFASWEDAEGDGISETPFEDVALISRAIYNKLSELDESLSAGAFQVLFYPTAQGETIPKDLIDGEGFSTMNAISYNGSLSQKPFFESAKVSDNYDSFDRYITKLTKEILNVFGLDKDTEKAYAQSGVAKSLEFMKAKSLLRIAAGQIQEVEERIFEFVAMWKNIDSEVEVIYSTDFDTNDVNEALKRLIESFDSLPYKLAKAALAKQIVVRSLPDLEQKELDLINEDIDNTETEKPSTIGDQLGGAKQPGIPAEAGILNKENEDEIKMDE